MKMYLYKNVTWEKFSEVYELLKNSYPSPERIESVQFSREKPDQGPPNYIVAFDMEQKPLFCMGIQSDGELTGFMKRYKSTLKLSFMVHVALNSGARFFIGFLENSVHLKLASLLGFRRLEDRQLELLNKIANIVMGSSKPHDLVCFGVETEKRNGPREVLEKFIQEVANNYIVHRIENRKESLKHHPLELIAFMTSRNIVPLIPENVDWEVFVRISPKDDPETNMAAVLLDREGKFHIFHDYSVPQTVDFSTLA